MAKILYLGKAGETTTSRHRANALLRLGHDVIFADPYRAMNSHVGSRLLHPLHYRTGYRLIQQKMRGWLVSLLGSYPECCLVWVDGGELLGPDCLRAIASASRTSVLFNHDDPTGTRDGRRFDMLKQALRFYSVSVAIREENEIEYVKLGARKVVRSRMTYDEIAHHPFASVDEIDAGYFSEVAFVGTWIPGENRDRFIYELLQNGVPVTIRGSAWQRSSLWGKLEPCWRGSEVKGRNYVAAIQGAKLCLGLLSKQNRDRHTTRSLEIPYAGGLLCAERTVDHLQMFEENREAVFWSDPAECAEKCRWLLQDQKSRERIRLAGMKRVREIKAGNEDLCRKVLESIDIVSPKPC